MRYDTDEYLDKHPDWHVEHSPWKTEQVMSMIRKHDLRPKTVCEVGCGAGEILALMAPQMPGTEFVGYEIAPQAHEMSASRVSDRVRFELKDLLETDDHFDLVLCIDVVEHIEQHLDFLRRLKTHGDKVLIHIPLEISVSSVLRPNSMIASWDDRGHVQKFTPEIALRTFREAGYTILDHKLTPRALGNPQLNANLRTRVANLPRRAVDLVSRPLAARLFGGYSFMALAE